MAVVLFRGEGRLPRTQIAVAVDLRAADVAERCLVLDLGRVLEVGIPAAVRPTDRRPRDGTGRSLVVREEVALGAVIGRRDEEVHVGVVANALVALADDIGDIRSVGRLGMAPLLGAAVDRVSLLDEVCVLATRREHLPLFALGVWRLEFGEVVVTPVEGELEPLEDADLIERFRVVTTRMLNAVEEFTRLEDERARDLRASSRRREPLDTPLDVRCVQRLVLVGAVLCAGDADRSSADGRRD